LSVKAEYIGKLSAEIESQELNDYFSALFPSEMEASDATGRKPGSDLTHLHAELWR